MRRRRRERGVLPLWLVVLVDCFPLGGGSFADRVAQIAGSVNWADNFAIHK